MRDDRTLSQTVALILGVVYTLVGILGFIPPLLQRPPDVTATGPLAGDLLGIFTVNWFHSTAHLLIGLAGLAAFRSWSASKTYLLVVGIAYAALFLLGLLNITLGGLLPLNGADDILHLLTAVLLLAVYFMDRGRVTATA